MVERALDLSTADDCVVIVDEGSTANLRFAGNTLTTNGVARSSQLTVISIVGRGVGVVSRAAVRPEQLADVVAAAEHAAAATPSRPRTPGRWSRATVRPTGTRPAEPTSIEVFGAFAPALGEAFAAAEAGGRKLYGFAEHIVTTTFLGTSTGTAAAARPADRPPGAQRQVAGHEALGLDRRGHPRLLRRGRRGAGRLAGPAARVGEAPDRPARGPVRDAAAADARWPT